MKFYWSIELMAWGTCFCIIFWFEFSLILDSHCMILYFSSKSIRFSLWKWLYILQFMLCRKRSRRQVIHQFFQISSATYISFTVSWLSHHGFTCLENWKHRFIVFYTLGQNVLVFIAYSSRLMPFSAFLFPLFNSVTWFEIGPSLHVNNSLRVKKYMFANWQKIHVWLKG